MPLFNITTGDGVYFHPKDNLDILLKLSATENFSSSSQYSVSTLPTVDTFTVTDAITRQPKKVQLSGVIVPSVLGIDGEVTVADFVATVETWRKQRQVITVHLPDGLSLEQTFITDFNASRDKANSTGFNIDISFDEIMSFPQQVGKGQATVIEGDKPTSTAQATTKNGGVTSKVEKGQQSTTEGGSRKACDGILGIEHTYKGKRSDILDAMSGCKLAKVSGATPEQKAAAEEDARQVYKTTGANTNKNKGAI